MVKISIVIPTFHRRILLKKCLSRLCHQDMDPSLYEMIIADDENSLETKTLVLRMKAENPRHQFVYSQVGPQHGPASARNCGWRKAKGGIIAFTDDDCLPQRDWLSKALAAFDKRVDAVWGKVIV